MVRFENGQLKDLVDPIDSQDGMTLAHATAFGATLPITWVNGVQKTSVKQYFSTATVSSGTVTFNLTDDGTSGGNAVFSNIYTESMNLLVFDSSNQYQFSGLSIAGNKKTLSVTINKLGTVLVGIIQFITAANGITVYLQVCGD